MLFVKLVILYDFVLAFFLFMYKMHIKGMKPSEKFEFYLGKPTKFHIFMSFMFLVGILLSFMAGLIFLTIVLF